MRQFKIALIEQYFDRELGDYRYARLEPRNYQLSNYFETMEQAKDAIFNYGLIGNDYEIFTVKRT